MTIEELRIKYSDLEKECEELNNKYKSITDENEELKKEKETLQQYNRKLFNDYVLSKNEDTQKASLTTLDDIINKMKGEK